MSPGSSPGLALLAAGKRDLSYDAHLPVPRTHFRPCRDAAPAPLAPGHAIEALNDQHAFIIGDMIGLGISHPCQLRQMGRALRD